MKNYRIKKVTESNWIGYFPQRKILGLFWIDMFRSNPYYVGFDSYGDAHEALYCAIRKPEVEYIDVHFKNE
jgi:hypothetical protein